MASVIKYAQWIVLHAHSYTLYDCYHYSNVNIYVNVDSFNKFFRDAADTVDLLLQLFPIIFPFILNVFYQLKMNRPYRICSKYIIYYMYMFITCLVFFWIGFTYFSLAYDLHVRQIFSFIFLGRNWCTVHIFWSLFFQCLSS